LRDREGAGTRRRPHGRPPPRPRARRAPGGAPGRRPPPRPPPGPPGGRPPPPARRPGPGRRPPRPGPAPAARRGPAPLAAPGAAAAFNAANTATVRITAGATTVLDTVFAFTPADRLRLAFRTPRNEPSGSLTLGLRRGVDLLFRGSGAVAVLQGDTTEVT